MEKVETSSIWSAFKKIDDPQLRQNIAVGSLLVGGKLFGYINISLWNIFLVLGTAVLVDGYLGYRRLGRVVFPHSALSSGTGISIFLVTGNPFIYIFAALCAILSKHFLHFKGKHFLNPSYSAMFLVLILFPLDVFVNPLQWEGRALPVIAAILLGLFVQERAKFLDGILTFLVSFLVFLFAFTNANFEDLHTLVLTGSFFIIAIYGISDPVTAPRSRLRRFLFIVQIPALYFLLRPYINENYAIFAAYLGVQALDVVFQQFQDKQWKIFPPHVAPQAVATIFMIMGLAYYSFGYAVDHGGIRQNVLDNRCNKLVCAP